MLIPFFSIQKKKETEATLFWYCFWNLYILLVRYIYKNNRYVENGVEALVTSVRTLTPTNEHITQWSVRTLHRFYCIHRFEKYVDSNKKINFRAL